MPHLMCRTCRLRFQRPHDDSLDAPTGTDACPSCGQPLTTVSDLRRLVGLRAETGPDRDLFRRGCAVGHSARAGGAVTDAGRAYLADLEAEERYHRERYDLYRARVYGPRLTSDGRLRELKAASDRAKLRLTAARRRRDPHKS